MAMFRIQKDKENPYVMLNKQFLNDERLSWKAKGLLAYLLSLPDDWQIYEEEITKHSSDGIKSTNSGVKELIEYGYIERRQLRGKKGKFSSYEYCVYEVSTATPKTENGEKENRKKELRKKQATNNDLTNNKLTNNIEGVETTERWEGTPNGGSKAIPFSDYLVTDIKRYKTSYKLEIVETILYYYGRYYEKFNKEHFRYSTEQLKEIYSKLNYIFDVGVDDNDTGRLICLDADAIKDVIDQHFNTNYSGNMSWTLLSFLNDNVLKNRCYEVGCV